MNLAQKAASIDDSEYVAVVACPGSGKSTTLVAAIKDDAVFPGIAESICAITYTNAAANVLKERLGVEIGYCGTLHGFCLRLLRRYNPAITLIDEQEAKKVLLTVAKKLNYKGTAIALEEARATFWSKVQQLGTYTDAERVALDYAATLQRENLLEYDLLLARALHRIRLKGIISPVRFYIDEFQDASDLDMAIYNEHPHSRLFAVGDIDQSIYSFRGSNPQNLMKVYEHGSKHELTINYRSHPVIIDAANRLIAHNKQRVPIQMTADPEWSLEYPEGTAEVVATLTPSITAHDMRVAICVSETLARGVSPNDIAILCRTNQQVRDMTEWLTQRGLITHANQTEEVPDMSRVRTLIGLALNPRSKILQHLERMATDNPEIKMEPVKTVTELLDFVFTMHRPSTAMGQILAEAKKGCPDAQPHQIYAFLGNREVSQKGNGVQVGTLHWSKGQEFEKVIIAHADVPIDYRPTEEDRRLFYVGLTRARSSCSIFASSRRWVEFKGVQDRQITPFVEESGTTLMECP